MATVYFARWILLPDWSLLESGAIAVEGNRISGVGSRGSVRRSHSDRAVNLGDTLLIPGLINMHTHLEEGVLRGLCEDGEPFAGRFAKKAARLRQTQPRAVETAVRLGVREMLTNGITCVVDSSRLGHSAAVLAEEPIRAWVQYELHPDREESCEECLTRVEQRIRSAPPGVRPAMGPYALFSLDAGSYRRTVHAARKHRYPWLCHVAESAEEVQAFSEQNGDLFFMLTRHRPWPFAAAGAGPMHHATAANLIPNNAVCIHCNYATGTDLGFLAVKQATVVTCPRYNYSLGHKQFPIDLARSRGVRLCAATESAAEAGTLSLFDELYALRTWYPAVPAAELLSWVTRNPAVALGMGAQLGSLAAGFLADIVGVRVAHDPRRDLLEELVTEDASVNFVMVDGEEVVVGP